MNGETNETPPETSSATSPSEVIARNLNALFNEDKRPDGRKVTNQEVAEYVTRATGHPCHRTWIAKLRGGKVTAPDLVRLDTVAGFFGRTRADLVGVEDPVESYMTCVDSPVLLSDSKPTMSTLSSWRPWILRMSGWSASSFAVSPTSGCLSRPNIGLQRKGSRASTATLGQDVLMTW